jgi:hypothetical protein
LRWCCDKSSTMKKFYACNIVHVVDFNIKKLFTSHLSLLHFFAIKKIAAKKKLFPWFSRLLNIKFEKKNCEKSSKSLKYVVWKWIQSVSISILLNHFNSIFIFIMENLSSKPPPPMFFCLYAIAFLLQKKKRRLELYEKTKFY